MVEIEIDGKTVEIQQGSMVMDAEKAGPALSSENDPRITPWGRVMRKWRIDELPQLVNILRGEMSLVGPRPHALHHDTLYSQDIVDYFARHNIKPGITGLAQVRGLRGETTSVEQMQARVEADIEYINNWSLWLDIKIIIRTMWQTILRRDRNAY